MILTLSLCVIVSVGTHMFLQVMWYNKLFLGSQNTYVQSSHVLVGGYSKLFREDTRYTHPHIYTPPPHTQALRVIQNGTKDRSKDYIYSGLNNNEPQKHHIFESLITSSTI